MPARAFKDNPIRMTTFLDWPVKDKATWNDHQKWLDPNTPEHWPSDWNMYVQEMNGKSEPLALEVGSFFGFLREWVGTERILYMFYDDPVLVEDIMEQVLYLETEVQESSRTWAGLIAQVYGGYAPRCSAEVSSLLLLHEFNCRDHWSRGGPQDPAPLGENRPIAAAILTLARKYTPAACTQASSWR